MIRGGDDGALPLVLSSAAAVAAVSAGFAAAGESPAAPAASDVPPFVAPAAESSVASAPPLPPALSGSVAAPLVAPPPSLEAPAAAPAPGATAGCAAPSVAGTPPPFISVSCASVLPAPMSTSLSGSGAPLAKLAEPASSVAAAMVQQCSHRCSRCQIVATLNKQQSPWSSVSSARPSSGPLTEPNETSRAVPERASVRVKVMIG